MKKVYLLIFFLTVGFNLSLFAEKKLVKDDDLHLWFTIDTETHQAYVGTGIQEDNNALGFPDIDDPWWTNQSNLWETIHIPSLFFYEGENYTVTEILSYAFYRTTKIKHVELPNTIKSIGTHAFYWCVNLETINIPGGVTTIEKSTFEWCKSLKNIELLSGLLEIKDKAFSDCIALEEINIPESCTMIGNDAFKWCRKLSKIRIEDSENVLNFGYSYDVGINYVTSSPKEPVYRGQFADCPLTEIYLGRNLSFPNSEDGKNRPCIPFERGYLNYFYIIGEGGYLFDVDQLTLEFGNSITSIPDRLFTEFIIKNEVVFPDNLKTIGNGVFSHSLKGNNKLLLPKGIEYIGSSAFANNSISGTLTLPEGIEYIGSSAFANNSISGTLTLPEGIEYIGSGAFANNGIEEISFPDGIKTINGFNGNRIRDLTIPSSVIKIVPEAFSDNPLRNVNCNTEIPPSESNPFSSAPIYVPVGKGNLYRQQWLDALIVDDSDEIISINVKTAGTLYSRLLAQDYQTGDVCKLKLKGTLNDNDLSIINDMSNLYYLDLSEMQVGEVTDGLFQNTPRLVTVQLPNTLTSIQDDEFKGCLYLTGDIHIPTSCTSIGKNAFANTAITSLTYSGAITIDDSAFENCYGLHEVEITPGSIIGTSAFQGTNIQSITVGSGTSIGENAFDNTGLRDVVLDSNVNEVGDGAFGEHLERITFNGPVNSIGNVFSEKLSEVHVSDVATWCLLPFTDEGPMKYSPHLYIGEEEATDVVVPNNVSNLRDYAFLNCNSLTSVTLSPGVRSIGNEAFKNCANLTSVVLPVTLTEIGEKAFQNCGELVAAQLPSKLTGIGESAFSGCGKLASMALPLGVDVVHENTFKDCTALTSLSLSAKVTSIQENAFSNCSSLAKLDLPSSITSIEQHAFENCSALQTVAVHWDDPITIADVFTSISSNCYLYCPIGTATKYFNAGWNVFTNLKEAGILSIDVNSGGTVSCYDTFISDGEDDVYFTPYKSFYVNLTPVSGFVVKRVKLNEDNVISQIEGDKLFLEEPEENMKLSVVFADASIEQGDVNGDGVINQTDAISTAKYILKNPPQDFYDYWGDMNDDGKVNITDAILVISKYLKK